jgi:hypothetical protein
MMSFVGIGLAFIAEPGKLEAAIRPPPTLAGGKHFHKISGFAMLSLAYVGWRSSYASDSTLAEPVASVV